jgi:prefoldin subunit 5
LSQTKLKNIEAENTTLKSQVSERDTQLETLKNSTGDVEGMKKQIETLGGEIKVESTVNIGTTFYIYIKSLPKT